MSIKNTVTISLIIFIIAVIAILGAGVFLNQNKTNTAPSAQQSNVSTNSSNVSQSATIITSVDVAKHNSESDCWVIISGKVYNVTSIIPGHPGGPNAIIALCGKDATNTFDTRNGRGPHPQRAVDILTNYYVGDLTR